MFSQELFCSLRNELAAVSGRAELLTFNAAERTTLEYSKQIKVAVLKIPQSLQRPQENPA
jgi:hypothetical protein